MLLGAKWVIRTGAQELGNGADQRELQTGKMVRIWTGREDWGEYYSLVECTKGQRTEQHVCWTSLTRVESIGWGLWGCNMGKESRGWIMSRFE